jgi:hypothetical protein
VALQAFTLQWRTNPVSVIQFSYCCCVGQIGASVQNGMLFQNMLIAAIAAMRTRLRAVINRMNEFDQAE